MGLRAIGILIGTTNGARSGEWMRREDREVGGQTAVRVGKGVRRSGRRRAGKRRRLRRGKSKRQKHKSFSGEQSLLSSGHRRRKDRQETVSSDSGSDEAHDSKRHRYVSGSYVGHRVTSTPIVSSPQVSDALRARVRAMLQSVAPK